MRHALITFLLILAGTMEPWASESGITPSNALVTERESVTFQHGNADAGDWELFIEVQHSYNKSWKKYLEASDSRHFEVYADAGAFDWHYCSRVVENSHSYHKGMVVFSNEAVRDTAYLRLDLAPLRPILRNVNIDYDYFDYELWDFVNPQITFDVECERASFGDRQVTFNLWRSEYSPQKFGEYFFGICEPLLSPDVIKLSENVYRFSTIFTWEQKIYLLGHNSYGFSAPSDTVFTNDYITDPDILALIDRVVSGVGDVSCDGKTQMSVKDGKITMSSAVPEINVSSIDGVVVASRRNCSQIDIAALPKGIYCAVAIDSKGNKLIKKFTL